MTQRHAWIDASAGVAGDMLLGALIDAGADVEFAQRCIDQVLPDSVRLRTEHVTRAGIAAIKVHVDVLVADPPHRTWRTISTMLTDAGLPEPVRTSATAVFARLAEAEGRVHGVPADDIHFHEVGALDSIADVVGVCAGIFDLAIDQLTASKVAVGSGFVRAAHGRIPVPVPAVTRLADGWTLFAGGEGELTTPTGMALLATLCAECTDLPAMRLQTVGLGAGTKDFAGHANVTRLLIGERTEVAGVGAGDPAVVLEANVDDLDPRLWPGVLADLMAGGASDAWLVPIMMKKGRPAHTLCVLAHPSATAGLRELILTRTSTIGVRQQEYRKFALPRAWSRIRLGDGQVMIKIAHRDGLIKQVTPEFDDVVAVAAAAGKPTRVVLAEAIAAAQHAGLVIGVPVPENARTTPH
ncbi:nickel pincer cofactor biosynthesis protein LarC [Microlunatus elymi]|uniref:Pyridinium-3,5-bisthiocarboxylic acid mononucleotide nickel insertion protein n=1 Tax=Microlunatus elymi TaxID=2596828 RepID=A0A516Q0D3_9ACTN|nr:nickel pincer cofactor biosynthesis protein LarC [Microlunatus elymi]QDP96899.1 nickel pincer cofactor biosynthesis protein LarC [Microlunatus elymi]